MLFAVALADPDDPNACDPSTGVPPNIAAPDRELLRLPGVAEATLAAIKARGETLPEGTVEGDLEKAREAARRDGNDVAAGGGACGEAAALLLRSQERAVCEADVGLVDSLRAELRGGERDEVEDGDGDGDAMEKKRKKDEDSNGGDVPSKAKGGEANARGRREGFRAAPRYAVRKHRLPPEPRENRERGGVTSPRTGRGVGRKTGHPRSRRGIRIAAVFARA